MRAGEVARQTIKAIAVMWLLLLLGCVTGNQWALRHDTELTGGFGSLSGDPGYRFYYYGLENQPYAVIGIDRAYHIKDPDWREVTYDSETYRKVVGLVKSFPYRTYYSRGSYILDSSGQQVGVWYSSLIAGIRADPESRDVIVTPVPDPLRIFDY